MHFRIRQIDRIGIKSIECVETKSVKNLDMSEKTGSIINEKIAENCVVIQSEAFKPIRCVVTKSQIPPELIRVLLVAVQDYANQEYNTIKHPVSDAIKMHRYLKEIRHIPAQNFKRIYNNHATRAAVIDGFKWLAESKYGVFYFTGHGYMLEYNGRKVEGLLLHDHAWARPHMLLDVDIHDALSSMTHCVMIIDACHSGGIAYKGVKRLIVKGIAVPKKIDLGKLKIVQAKKDFVFLTACQPSQVAFEDSEVGGVFTDALIKIWENDPEINLTDLQNRLRNSIKYNQLPLIEACDMGLGLFEI